MSDLGIPPGVPTILWVGRLDVVKGIDVLLHALHSVRQRIDVHLLLAGDGPYRATLEPLAAALGLSDRVHFLGVRDDVLALLHSTDVFAFPSRTEGLPNALLEAMACGCAIVTTDVPGCRDLIVHGHAGLLVPPDNANRLSEALLQLLRDGAVAQRLGANAQREVRAHWQFDQTLDAYEAVYRQTMG